MQPHIRKETEREVETQLVWKNSIIKPFKSNLSLKADELTFECMRAREFYGHEYGTAFRTKKNNSILYHCYGYLTL